MTFRFLCFIVGLTALVSVAQGQVAPQTARANGKAAIKGADQHWTVPRTPDGKPDLQGYWANNNATPLERPKELAGRATLTNEEVAAMKKKAHELFNGNGDAAFGDSVFTATLANVQGTKTGFKSTDGGTGDYSSVWTVERDWDNRTSLITDPPDGRIPAMTPAAQERRQAALAVSRHPPEGPEDRSLSERCITFGSPQLTEGYQSNYQIVQTPRSVAFMTEMIHDVRSDSAGRPPARSRRRAGVAGGFARPLGRRHAGRRYDELQTASLHVGVQRQAACDGALLTQRSGDAEVRNHDRRPGDLDETVEPDDPVAASPPVYEYACHEGNEGLAGILAGARAEDAKAARDQAQK